MDGCIYVSRACLLEDNRVEGQIGCVECRYPPLHQGTAHNIKNECAVGFNVSPWDNPLRTTRGRRTNGIVSTVNLHVWWLKETTTTKKTPVLIQQLQQWEIHQVSISTCVLFWKLRRLCHFWKPTHQMTIMCSGGNATTSKMLLIHDQPPTLTHPFWSSV